MDYIKNGCAKLDEQWSKIKNNNNTLGLINLKLRELNTNVFTYYTSTKVTAKWMDSGKETQNFYVYNNAIT